jgi:hypothetical protein
MKVAIVSCMPAPGSWWHGFHLAELGAYGTKVKRTVVAMGATVDHSMIRSPCACQVRKCLKKLSHGIYRGLDWDIMRGPVE